jgi:hypothetical protein
VESTCVATTCNSVGKKDILRSVRIIDSLPGTIKTILGIKSLTTENWWHVSCHWKATRSNSISIQTLCTKNCYCELIKQALCNAERSACRGNILHQTQQERQSLIPIVNKPRRNINTNGTTLLTKRKPRNYELWSEDQWMSIRSIFAKANLTVYSARDIKNQIIDPFH